jgi:predicted phage-related endonuclease
MPAIHRDIDAAYSQPTRSRPTKTSNTHSKPMAIDAGRHALVWPRLGELILGREEQARRRDVIGGSDANIILGGSEEALLRLWQEKRGEADPEDLSSRLAVVLGCWTEAFNRQWYENATGELITGVGRSLRCPVHAFRGCTLDGYVERVAAVWEAKHTSPFSKPEDILTRYMPQLQHNMAVAGSQRAILSVIFGNGKWEVFEVASDWLYQEELLEAEARFWACVRAGTPPVAVAAPPAPKPVGVREICLEGSNSWASAAADWLAHRDAAKKHAAAVTSLKSLVEDDVARAFGHGVEAKRSKTGAISIRELAA